MGRAWQRGETAESHARGDEWRAPGRGILLTSVHNGGWWTSVPRSTMGPQSPFSKRTFMRINHMRQQALHIRKLLLSPVTSGPAFGRVQRSAAERDSQPAAARFL